MIDKIKGPGQYAAMIRKKIEGYSHIIWDWNGTLLNDVQLTLFAVSEQLISSGLKVPTVREHRANFGFPILDYYIKLGFDLKKVAFLDLANKFYQNYFENIDRAELFEGSESLLKDLRSQGKNQSILSAADHLHLKKVLKLKGIYHLFDQVFGIEHQLADSKLEVGK